MFSNPNICLNGLCDGISLQVQELVEDVKHSLNLRLQELEWMDEATKDAAKAKVWSLTDKLLPSCHIPLEFEKHLVISFDSFFNFFLSLIDLLVR